MTVFLAIIAVVALGLLAWAVARIMKLSSESSGHLAGIAGLETRATIAERQSETLARQLEGEKELRVGAEREVARLQAIIDRDREQAGERERMLNERFANMATDILRRNSEDFKAASAERLDQILNPLRTNIDEFKRTVRDAYEAESRQRFSLEEAVKTLANANNTISQETRDLTNALRGNNAVQGQWGEMVLESILEKSGLVKGTEYVVQATTDADGKALRNEDGTPLRPDVVVNYPDDRCVVIDSKVSLTAYVEYVNARDNVAEKSAGDRHVRAIRTQVDGLSRKKYADFVGVDKLDFVMMFIPNEPAYMTAMRLDPQLWQYAYDKGVLIVSPTHLVSALRLIAQLWSRDKVTKNAIKIAEDAGKMYDKFADFCSDMEKIDKAITATRKAHDDAMRKLSDGTGNLMKRAEDLRALGIRATKQLAKGK